MIYVGNIREMVYGAHDHTYAIVRSFKSSSDWIEQLAVLSPDWDLFRTYRELQDKGNWNQRTFDELYVPRFLAQMKNDPQAADALNDLFHRSKHGENIALCCFCGQESMCHRSIIAGLLQGAGAEVKLRSGADYSSYFKRFKSL